MLLLQESQWRTLGVQSRLPILTLLANFLIGDILPATAKDFYSNLHANLNMSEIVKMDWGQALEDYASPAGSFLGNVGAGIMKGICGIYRNNPASVPRPSPLDDFFNMTCPQLEEDLPPAPTIPFQGGQCEGVRYFLAFDRVQCDGSLSPDGTGSVLGPIVTASIVPSVSTGNCPNDGPPEFRWRFDVVGAGGDSTGGLTNPSHPDVANVRLVATDGSDILACGDPDPDFGPPNPLPPEINIDIQFNNGQPAGPNQKDIDIPVAIPIINNEINFPITVDVGGIIVNVDIGGLQFDLGDQGNPQIDNLLPSQGTQLTQINNKTTNIENSIGGCETGIGDANNKLDNIIPKVDDILEDTEAIEPKIDDLLEEVEPAIDDAVEEPESDEEVSGGEDALGIAYVAFTITTSPKSGGQHTIVQSNANFSTLFAGYMHWVFGATGERLSPALPIRTLSSVFRNPGKATGFRFYAVNGAKLKYQVFKKVIGT